MLARVRTPARARVDVNRATTAAKARTLARARAAAQPTARNLQPKIPSSNYFKTAVSGVEGRTALPALDTCPHHLFASSSGVRKCLPIALTATRITESESV